MKAVTASRRGDHVRGVCIIGMGLGSGT